MDIYAVFYLQDRTNTQLSYMYDIRRILAVVPTTIDKLNDVCTQFRAAHQSLYEGQPFVPQVMIITRHPDTSFLEKEAKHNG